MKSIIACVAAVSAMLVSARAADVTAKITDVHICCKSCVTLAEKAVAEVPNVTAKADQEEGTVTLPGPDTASVQKAADALIAAGFFGKSNNADIKSNASTGAKGEKVQTLEVSGVHLCCAKCVKAVNAVCMAVPGVQANTAAKGVKTFQVTGDFNDADLLAALQKAGLTGKVGPAK